MSNPLDDACRYIDTGKMGDYRFLLLADFRLAYPFGREFENKWGKISADGITIREGYACDGATGARDTGRYAFVVPGVFCHDYGYQFAEDIAAAWGVSVREVLRIFDEVFLSAMLDNISEADDMKTRKFKRRTAHLYYRAVRLVGYRFHVIARRIRQWTGNQF